MELLGVKFAPLRVPTQRRLQTLAACAWFCSLAFGGFIGWLFTLYCLIWGYWLRYITLMYLCWCYYDWDTYKTGGRNEKYTHWMRNFVWWRYFRDFFPVSLIKTADLDPSRNYLLCAFPHGILSSGVFSAFSTDALDCKKLFPGLELRVLTLEQHYKMPFFRDFAYSFGACGAGAESIEYLLRPRKDNEKHCGAVLIVGGAAESFKCKPGTYDIILNKRRGFVRMALKTGTPLVPVFSFGETDLYDQIRRSEDSYLTKFQEFIKKALGLAPVIIIGRGFFQYSFGLIPNRKPVTVVVGAPIELPKIPNPTTDDINKYHSIFKSKLTELFENEKHKYLKNPEQTMLNIE